jgi:cytochrome c oxidase assembly protein subunit 15
VLLSGERMVFYIHRTFSWVLVAYLFWLASGLIKIKRKIWANALMMVVAAETILGVLLNYFEFPAFAQPTHLLLSFVLFGILLNGFLTKSTHIG